MQICYSCKIRTSVQVQDKFNFCLILGIGINIVNSPYLNNYETTYLNNYSKKKINKIKLINEIKLIFEKKYKDIIL